MGMAVNVVAMYPLQIAPVRDSALGLARAACGWEVHQDNDEKVVARAHCESREFFTCTLLLVFFSVICAWQGVALSSINLAKGVFIMPMLCFVIPMLLYRKTVAIESGGDWTLKITWFLLAIGLAIMLDGPYELVVNHNAQVPVRAAQPRIKVESVPHMSFRNLP
mmetsp:Transcript_20344/g.65582  ORF Transcript_20344/g.65582 Transcript_20344/m.65582 type:complete len:165 (-) Transcript_20344:87-581(-)